MTGDLTIWGCPQRGGGGGTIRCSSRTKCPCWAEIVCWIILIICKCVNQASPLKQGRLQPVSFQKAFHPAHQFICGLLIMLWILGGTGLQGMLGPRRSLLAPIFVRILPIFCFFFPFWIFFDLHIFFLSPWGVLTKGKDTRSHALHARFHWVSKGQKERKANIRGSMRRVDRPWGGLAEQYG